MQEYSNLFSPHVSNLTYLYHVHAPWTGQTTGQ